MSGTGASNLGYGDTYPNSNVNSNYVNVDGSTYAGGFGSNQIPSSSHSMPGASNNIQAASGNWMCGGGRRRKNISRVYKMKATRHYRRSKTSKKRMNQKKSTGRKRTTKRRMSSKRRRVRMHSSKKRGTRSRRMRAKKQRGGTYAQYGSNVPYTPGYSVGGELSAANSAMASPAPYHAYDDCQDNYNHYAATQK
jgi:hypothetical protein